MRSAAALLAAALWCAAVAHARASNDQTDMGVGVNRWKWQQEYGRIMAPSDKADGSIPYNGGSDVWYTSPSGGSYRDYDNALSASGPSARPPMYYYNTVSGPADKNSYNMLYERSGNNLPNRAYYSSLKEDMDTTISTEEVTYPTGRPSRNAKNSSLYIQRQVVEASISSHFFISKKFESLDYIKIINQLEIAKERTQTFYTLYKEDWLRIMLFIVSGIITAFIGITVAIGIMKLGDMKYTFLSSYIAENLQENGIEFYLMILLWSLGSIIPVMVGSSLVVFIAPFASGGGVAQCVAYLNGVRVPRVLSIKGLVVKALSTICTCISGLAGGKEGPMMHMGAIAGGSLPSALPWQVFKSDGERRDLASAGFGAGIAVAFGAPIGGLLLALEEGVSFWNISLMWRTYVCCLFAYFVAILLLSFVRGMPGDLGNPKLLAFGRISTDVTEYELIELGIFAIEGLIGGLLGALLVYIHKYMTLFRRRCVQSKTKKLIESFLVACLVAFLSLSAVMVFRDCNSTKKLSTDTYENATRHTHKLYCGKDQYSEMSLMFFQTQEGVIHAMFGPDPIGPTSLFVFCVVYFVLLCFTMGLSISAGIFVPQIVFGSVWGRMFGVFVSRLIPDAAWARPAKYAYIGATAQLSGTVGKTFSILIIMIEASRSISFSIPLMVVVCITKYVESFFVLPIYETQMHLMGLPYLPSAAPSLCLDTPVAVAISSPPLVTLPLKPTVQLALDTLRNTQHNGFPIVTKGKAQGGLLGLILRQQLLVLLKYKAYKFPTPEDNSQLRRCLDDFLRNARRPINIEKIDVDPKYFDVPLDLTPYYNPYPYTIQETLPFSQAYGLFRSLGLRHMVVLNAQNEPIAMITRKDLAKFHAWEHLCRMGVKVMPIR